MQIERLVEKLSSVPTERPYYPFYAAVHKGILPPFDELKRERGNPPGVDIASGMIPDAKRAGVRNLGKEVGAFDHVHMTVSGRELTIVPSSKNDVNKQGRILREGAIVLERQSGVIKIAAFAIDVSTNPARLDAFREQGFYFMNRVGDLAIVSTGLLDIPEYEISDLEDSTGVIYARSRRKLR